MASFGLIFPAVWVWIAVLLNCQAWGVESYPSVSVSPVDHSSVITEPSDVEARSKFSKAGSPVWGANKGLEKIASVSGNGGSCIGTRGPIAVEVTWAEGELYDEAGAVREGLMCRNEVWFEGEGCIYLFVFVIQS